MRDEQLYLIKILPHLREFKLCEIYNYELRKLDQELAESMNQKNIYNAMDLPDFKHIKELKLENNIIKLACKKLGIGSEVEILKQDTYKILQIDNIKYQLIFFASGTMPVLNVKLDKLIFFMYMPKFQKIYYCGIKEFKSLSEKSLEKFYKEHCYNETKKFIDFKILNK